MENQTPNIVNSENVEDSAVVEYLYNIVDSDGNIIESNVSGEYVEQLLAAMNVEDGNIETTYFYWPENAPILEKILSESSTSVRFIKPATE